MDNNTRPIIRLSENNVRCLTEIGFKFGHVKMIPFDRYFEQLKAFKTKHGHCRAQICRDKDRYLGLWCSRVRQSIHKLAKNERPFISGLSDENVKRLEDLGVNTKMWRR